MSKIQFLFFIVCLISILIGCYVLKDIQTKNKKKNKIYSVDTLALLWEEINQLDAQSLVIFDIDKVLLTGAGKWYRGTKKQRQVLKKNINVLSGKRQAKIRSAMEIGRKRMLVDNQTPHLIRTLQNKNIKVIALTMCLAGRYFLIPQLEINRLQELKAFGFDFKRAFPHLNRYEFYQLSHKNRHPLYQDGVLFTAGYDKGNVLLAFLKKITWKPSRIIFVDNKQKNILSVMSAAEKLKIPFLGFLYKAAYKLPGGFDEKIAQFQIKYLIDHETLLDDAVAAELM